MPMLTAIQFTALGRGNGFPFCPTKVNVFDCDYWTTFSGVNKDNVDEFTDEGLATKIQESLALAMKLFWNAYGITGEATYSGIGFEESISSVNIEEAASSLVVFSGFADTDSGKTPMHRACWIGDWGVEKYGSSDIAALLWIGADIVRMYNGVTTDEDNFVGYGTASGFSQFALAETWSCAVSLLSYNDNAFAFDYGDFAYVDIGGMHFVCVASSAEAQGSCDAENLTATANKSSDIARINSLDFYTYA